MKVNRIFILFIVILLTNSLIKPSLIHPQKLYSIRNTRIKNRINECWFCLYLVNYPARSYSFRECSITYNSNEIFNVEYSKDKKIIKNYITNVSDPTFKLGTSVSNQLLILPANDENGVFIISSMENLCVTNDINSDPMPDIFQPCGDFFSNTEKYVFYFDNSQLTDTTFFTGLVSLYKRGTNDLMDYTYITNNIVANYPGFGYYVSTTGSGNTSLFFSISNNPFKISVPISPNQYVLYSNHESFQINPSYYCIHPSYPRPVPNDKFYTPFSTGYRCKNTDGNTNNFFVDYDIDTLNRTQFDIINSTRGTYLDTSYFNNNSDIKFTHSTTNVVYSYNVGVVPVTSFETRLHYGQYSTSVSLKPNINIDTFEGKIFVIDSCNYTKISIPVKEKANYVKFTYVEITNNVTITSNYFVANSIIRFKNSINGQNYDYNVGSISHSYFNIWLNFGDYTITLISIKNPIDYELKPGYSFSVNTYNTLELNLEIKVLRPLRWYKLNNSLHDEISGGNHINIPFAKYQWDSDSHKYGPGWNGNSLRSNSKRIEGLRWQERNDVNNNSNPILNSGIMTDINFPANRPYYTVEIFGYFFSRDYSGPYVLYIDSDDDSFLYLNGNMVIDNGGYHAMLKKSISYFISFGTYLPIYIMYSNRNSGGGFRFSFSSPWAHEDSQSRTYLFYELNTEILIPAITFPSEYTFTMWVKPFENHDNAIFHFLNANDSFQNFGMAFRSGSNDVFLNFQDKYWNSNNTISINQWNLIGMAIKEGGKLCSLVNKNRQETIESLSNVSFYADRLIIGLNGAHTGSALNARYKDFRIYDRFFTQEMLDYLYDN